MTGTSSPGLRYSNDHSRKQSTVTPERMNRMRPVVAALLLCLASHPLQAQQCRLHADRRASPTRAGGRDRGGSASFSRKQRRVDPRPSFEPRRHTADGESPRQRLPARRRANAPHELQQIGKTTFRLRDLARYEFEADGQGNIIAVTTTGPDGVPDRVSLSGGGS
jgi:hypothetical protein